MLLERILAGRISAWMYLETGTLSAAVIFVEVLARLASTHTPSCCAAADKDITLANSGDLTSSDALMRFPAGRGHISDTLARRLPVRTNKLTCSSVADFLLKCVSGFSDMGLSQQRHPFSQQRKL